MLTDNEYLNLASSLEKLEKSFNAMGYPNAQFGGRTGVAALARPNLDPLMHSIAASDKHLNLIKGIKKEKATSSVYTYKLRTAWGMEGIDLSGLENFLPQEDQGQYEQVVEPLKIYGIKKTIGEMVMLSNQAGGFDIDMEKENEESALKMLSMSFERDGYAGGDFYLAPTTGLIDPDVSNRVYGRSGVPAVRQVRGIQSMVRFGNENTLGISQDYASYGNAYSVVIDQADSALDQDVIDDMASAIHSNGQGTPSEAHCQAVQAAEFRKQLFPLQRGDISSKFKIAGPDVDGSYDKSGFVVESAVGPIHFKPCLFKHSVLQKVKSLAGGAGAAPAAPTAVAQASAAVTGVTSPFAAAATIRVTAQAVNIHGRSGGTVATCTVTNAGEAAILRLTRAADAECIFLFANPVGNATVGNEGFIGKVLLTSVAVGGTVDVRIVFAIHPGYEPVVFMSDNDEGDRLKMATLGNMINKTVLGQLGTSLSTAYTSYFCFVMPKPRSFGILDNCKIRRRS
jgi:hypothetical protein